MSVFGRLIDGWRKTLVKHSMVNILLFLGQLTRRPHLNCMDQGSLEFNMLSTVFFLYLRFNFDCQVPAALSAVFFPVKLRADIQRQIPF
jgi:hypothetical protein